MFRLAKYPLAPVVLGLILGPILEANLRRSLLMSRDGFGIFLDRPVAATLVIIDVAILLGFAVTRFHKWRSQGNP